MTREGHLLLTAGFVLAVIAYGLVRDVRDRRRAAARRRSPEYAEGFADGLERGLAEQPPRRLRSVD